MRFGPDPGGRRLLRLTKRSQFLKAASGRRFNVPSCTVQALAREPDELGPRVGFTLTKKTGHATERNRIRRRLRQAARLLLAERANESVDLVLIGRREALSRSFPLLLDDLARALKGATRSKSSPQVALPRPNVTAPASQTASTPATHA